MTTASRSSSSLLSDLDALRGIIDAVPHPVFVKDKYSRFVILNDTMCQLMGRSFGELIGKSDFDFFPKDQADIFRLKDLEVLETGEPNENEELFSDGTGTLRTIVTQKKRLVLSDGEPLLIGCITDISDFRRAEAQIRHQANHDALTGLPNRRAFADKIDSSGGKPASDIAVLFIDLDHFKGVNDTLGHAIGDEVLKVAAGRLVSCCRDGDTVARFGGDEFAILQEPLRKADDAAGLASRIVRSLAEPLMILDHQILIGASVGIAVAPSDGTDAASLIKNADLALYRAKNEGRSTFHFYEHGMDIAIQERRSLEIGLRFALAREEFFLAYQPLIELEKNRICAVEALLRWNHPVRGTIPPAEFLPVAEETGVIVSIGEWVLHKACKAAAAWPDRISIAVNVSPIQFKSGRLVQQVMAALKVSGLEPKRLELEVTETALLENNEMTLNILRQLRELGVRISMDDFGTGFSSLTYLRSFPFDKIKIDRSFVQGSSANDENRAIIKALIGLGHSLGISTTAEGVENEQQLNFVREQGCDEVQGFLFSRPLPISAVSELISRMEPWADRSVKWPNSGFAA